jgi:hypothetical protein
MEVTIARKGFQALAGATEQQSSEFIIKHEKLDLHIYLSSMNNLFLHEETIPDRVAELRREFLRDEIEPWDELEALRRKSQQPCENCPDPEKVKP